MNLRICVVALLVASGALAQYSPPAGGGGGGGSVNSVFGRTGTVAATTGDYTAAQVTNAADTSSTYSNPGWITALANSKISGLTAFATLATGASSTYVRGDASTQPLNIAALSDGSHVIVDSATYSNPAWITALANSKISGLTAFATLATGASTTYVRGDGTTQTRNCASLTDASASCATDATNASNIGSGTLPSGRLPAYSDYTTVSFSTTPTFTVTARTSVENFQITLTGNVTSSTLTTTNATNGQDIAFKICQDGTGSRTFVWPTNVVNPGAIPTAASTCGKQVFRFDGTNAVAFSPMVTDGATPGIQTATGFLTLPTGTQTLGTAGPGVGAHSSVNLSTGNGTYAVVGWDTNDWDTSGGVLHSTSVNTGRFTANSAGKWFMTCQGSLTSNNAVFVELRVNGTTAYAGNGTTAVGFNAVQVSHLLNLASGDYVECLFNGIGGVQTVASGLGSNSVEFFKVF